MSTKKITFVFSVFLLGLLLGAFVTTAVIREALPLKAHAVTIGIYLVTCLPVVIILFIYYVSLTKYVKNKLGEKGGEVINRVLTFLLVTILIVSILFLGLLFSAVA